MQSCGRLIQNIKRLALLTLAELQRQLDALRLAARQCGRGLPKFNVAESNIGQRFQLFGDTRLLLKYRQRFVDTHCQHVSDAVALKPNVQRLAIVAFP